MVEKILAVIFGGIVLFSTCSEENSLLAWRLDSDLVIAGQSIG